MSIMDVMYLARIQFAMTAIFHFLFVPLTLGLAPLVAWMETKHLTTGDEMYERMAKFWGNLFIINFALGVVTGLTMEFQFGMNWAKYSTYVGDIFGAPLAIEALAAFFLEKHIHRPLDFRPRLKFPGNFMSPRSGSSRLPSTCPPSGYCLQTDGCSTL